MLPLLHALERFTVSSSFTLKTRKRVKTATSLAPLLLQNLGLVFKLRQTSVSEDVEPADVSVGNIRFTTLHD